MKTNKTLQMLGLAARAGKLASGEFSVEKALKDGKAYLVILAKDDSDNTKKHFTDMCSYRKVPLVYHGTQESLGHAIGLKFRASVAVLDQGFAKRIEELAGQDASQDQEG